MIHLIFQEAKRSMARDASSACARERDRDLYPPYPLATKSEFGLGGESAQVPRGLGAN